jgi:5-methylthioadenosine/S-adenosylhomocysteine deaminase
MRVLLRGGKLITMNPKGDCFNGDILVEDGLIKKIAKKITKPANAKIVNCQDTFVIPGLIQAHTHLCQALFRGEADDLTLLNWLKKKIWPMEAAHTKASLKASAQIGLLEMQKLGSTSILDMGTVHHTNILFETARASGMRYWGGKCLMDRKSQSGPLWQTTQDSILETEKLIAEWHKANDQVHYVISPRFAVSCTEKLMIECREIHKQHKLLFHTHASENKGEIELVKKLTGSNNIAYFGKLNLLGPNTVLVHAVHPKKSEVDLVKKTKTKLVHCPSANLKLGSGFAPTEEYRKHNITVGIGSDGAPCNNTMDPFMEMRLAALMQKPLCGSTAMPAKSAFSMATINGAKVLGADKEIGSLEVGKKADIAIVNRSHPSVATVEDPYSALVYSCSGRDIEHVMINGHFVVFNKESLMFDEDEVLAVAKKEKQKLLKRI